MCRVSSGLSERLKFLPGLFEKSHIVVEGVVDRVARIGDGRRRRRRRRGQRSEATRAFSSLFGQRAAQIEHANTSRAFDEYTTTRAGPVNDACKYIYIILHIVAFHRGLGHAVGSERFDPEEGARKALLLPCCVRSCAHSGYARREAPRDTCGLHARHTPERTQGGARSGVTSTRSRINRCARSAVSPGRRRETPPRALTLGHPRNIVVVIISDDAQGRRLYNSLFFFSSFVVSEIVERKRSRHSWANVQRSLVRPIRGA